MSGKVGRLCAYLVRAQRDLEEETRLLNEVLEIVKDHRERIERFQANVRHIRAQIRQEERRRAKTKIRRGRRQ